MTQEMITRWSSRKFWTMIAATTLSTALLLLGKVSESTYLWLFGMTIGSYFTANVAQHFGQIK